MFLKLATVMKEWKELEKNISGTISLLVYELPAYLLLYLAKLCAAR